MKGIYLLVISLCCCQMADAQATFISLGGNWNMAGSWTLVSGSDPDGIPDADDQVYIQSGHTITLTVNESCLDLHISKGTTSTLGADGALVLGIYTLSLNGKLRCYYAFLGVIPGTGTSLGYSVYPFTGTGKISVVGNSRALTVGGEWGAGIITPSTGSFNLEINLNPGQNITMGTNLKCTFLNVIAGTLDLVATTMGLDNGTTGQGDVVVGPNGTVLSSGNVNNIFQRTATTPGGTLTVNGSLILSGAAPKIQMTADVFNGPVFYSGINQALATQGTSGTTPGVIPLEYNHLVLSGSGIKTTVASQITRVNVFLDLQQTATMDLGAAATLTYTPGAALRYFRSVVTITGLTPAEWPVVNPPSSLSILNIGGVTLNATGGRILTGVLTLSSGILTVTTSLTMAAGSAVGAVSNSSFVDGPVQKIGNTAFTFPVGKTGTGYMPIRVSTYLGSTVNDIFTAEYIRSSASALGVVNAGPGLAWVSNCDYWKLERGLATPTAADITVYWNANSPCGSVPYITNTARLTIAHFNSTTLEWDSYAIPGIVGGGSTNAVGNITWGNASTFSPFSIGSTSFGDNPLPITFNYFNGVKNNGNHLLNWKVTCASTPSATLEMERSTDGVHFSSIYRIFATALRCADPFAYTDNQPAKGVNYYRLKMISADGNVTYSSIVSLINSSKGIDFLNIAPNPILNGSFNVKISTAEKTQMELVITDMQGRLMHKKSVTMLAGFNVVPIQVRNLVAGTYQLFGISADGCKKVLRFVIQ